jgi:hypothetical protein
MLTDDSQQRIEATDCRQSNKRKPEFELGAPVVPFCHDRERLRRGVRGQSEAEPDSRRLWTSSLWTVRQSSPVPSSASVMSVEMATEAGQSL